MSARPGDSAEGITVPLGDPDTLTAAGRQLQGVSTHLETTSVQVATAPSLMTSWAGPGSTTFAGLTGHQAASLRATSTSVLMGGTGAAAGATAVGAATAQAAP